MSVEHNKKVAQRLVENLGTGGDVSSFHHLREDATWTVMADPASFPVSGSMTKTEFIAHMDRFHQSLPNGIRITITGTTAEDDRVAIEANSEALLPNGNTLQQVYHFLFEFEGDGIVAVREYIDTAHALNVFNGTVE